MPVNRIVVDVVSDEPIPNRTLNRLGKETSDFVQAVGSQHLENVDHQIQGFTVHHHTSSDTQICEPCAWGARDGKN